MSPTAPLFELLATMLLTAGILLVLPVTFSGSQGLFWGPTQLEVVRIISLYQDNRGVKLQVYNSCPHFMLDFLLHFSPSSVIIQAE